MQLTSQPSSQDTVQRGQQWYENGIRQQVDTEDNIGKIVAIDVATGEFVLASNHVAALAAMREKVTNPFLYFLRVGYTTPTKVGGALKRETR